MATRAIEARFERMSVNDENDPGDGSKLYAKVKVHTETARDPNTAILTWCL